jgi:hypothetical protein
VIIVTMSLSWAKGSNDRRTQYCWHVGEPFPVLHSWLEHVERLYADGEERDVLRNLVPVGEARAKVVDVEGSYAAYACEILLSHYKRV